MSDNLTQSFIDRATISLLQMLIRGYEPATSSTLPQRLRGIKPDGSTSMRDAVVQGTALMLDLFKVLNDQRMAQNWNFVHVILTDGGDNASKSSVNDTKAILKLIHDQLKGLNLKIIFIGVGVDSRTSSSIKQLAYSAGPNGSYHDINQSQIQNIFSKITVQLGLQLRRDVIGIQSSEGNLYIQRDQIQKQVTVTQNNYLILFNLDISGSMAGSKWNSVCRSVERFIGNLSNIDYVGGIIFNQKTILLRNEQLIRQLQQQARVQQLSPEQRRRVLRKCCSCCCTFIILIVVLIVVLTR